MKSRTSIFCVSILVFWLVVALFVPILPLPSPLAQNLAQEFSSPNSQHYLGTGENGVDLLAQLIWGARLALFVGLGTVGFSAFVGTLLGATAGYFRGTWDEVVLRGIEIVQAFPGVLLNVGMAVVLGPSVRNLIIAMSLSSWAVYARLARSQTLSLREREYVTAARALGASAPRILIRHIFPNLLGALTVQMTYGMGAAILTESALSFLGIGVPVGTPSWGQMLNQGREVLSTATHVIMVPSVALLTIVLSLNLLGDNLRDSLDPRTRG